MIRFFSDNFFSNRHIGFKKQHILFVVLIGTLVRYYYGLYAQFWLQCPDQLAWELSLDNLIANGGFSYKQLMYYPHEGAGFLISLFALCLKPISFGLPSLTLAALFIDTISRAIQIHIAHKLFGHQTAFWYALWTILASPLLLSWSTVIFCLHAASSFFPFVFLYLVSKYQHPKLCGVVAGLAIFFSYNNVVFIPAYMIFLFYKKETFLGIWKQYLQFLVFCILALLPHILLRVIPDNGFHLENLSVTNVREFTPAEFFSFNRAINLILVYFKVLPASFFLAVGGNAFSVFERVLILLFLISGAFFVFRKRNTFGKSEVMAALLIGLFIFIYAMSPFYANESNSKSFYVYRHLAYILPLLVLFLIQIFVKEGKIGMYFNLTWLISSFIFSGWYMLTTQAVEKGYYKEEGWILARKFGEEPATLMKLYYTAPEFQRTDLNFGYGWGLAAALLSNKTVKDTLIVKDLKKIYNEFPDANKKGVYDGIQHAFGAGITPVLDPEFLLLFNQGVQNAEESQH